MDLGSANMNDLSTPRYGTTSPSSPTRLYNKTVSSSSLTSSTSAPFIELRGSILDVGIFKDTLLPSLALHSTLSLIGYGVGRYTDRLEVKDLIWPGAQVINAWYASVGRRVFYGGLSLPQALSSLSRPERLLLTGVSVWGGRLVYRVATRGLFNKDKVSEGEEKYAAKKKEDGFWDRALVSEFLPQAVVQALVTLPFTAPFYHQGGVFTGYHPVVQSFAVGLFSAGLALEIMADRQLDRFVAGGKSATEVNTEGVWSIVRHPNYLGDALVHFSFPILLYASDMLAPIELLGPIANYLYLRYISGDKQNEESQATRYTGERKASFSKYQADEKINSFWPHVQQFSNQWLWTVVGAGVVGAGVEQIVHLMGLE